MKGQRAGALVRSNQEGMESDASGCYTIRITKVVRSDSRPQRSSPSSHSRGRHQSPTQNSSEHQSRRSVTKVTSSKIGSLVQVRKRQAAKGNMTISSCSKSSSIVVRRRHRASTSGQVSPLVSERVRRRPVEEVTSGSESSIRVENVAPVLMGRPPPSERRTWSRGRRSQLPATSGGGTAMGPAVSGTSTSSSADDFQKQSSTATVSQEDSNIGLPVDMILSESESSVTSKTRGRDGHQSQSSLKDSLESWSEQDLGHLGLPRRSFLRPVRGHRPPHSVSASTGSEEEVHGQASGQDAMSEADAIVVDVFIAPEGNKNKSVIVSSRRKISTPSTTTKPEMPPEVQPEVPLEVAPDVQPELPAEVYSNNEITRQVAPDVVATLPTTPEPEIPDEVDAETVTRAISQLLSCGHPRTISDIFRPSVIARQELAWRTKPAPPVATGALAGTGVDESSSDDVTSASTDMGFSMRSEVAKRSFVAGVGATPGAGSDDDGHQGQSDLDEGQEGFSLTETEESASKETLSLQDAEEEVDRSSVSSSSNCRPPSSSSTDSDPALSDCRFRLATLHHLLLSGRDHLPLTDMKVRIGRRTFPTHRLLLTAFSRHFRRLHDTGHLPPRCTVVLDDLSPAGLAATLAWITTGHLDVAPQTAGVVQETALALGVERLPDRCEEFLTAWRIHLEQDDPLPLYSFLVDNGMDGLVGQVRPEVEARLEGLLSAGRHLDYTVRQLCHLLEVLDNDGAFNVARDWLLHDWRGRCRYQERVLRRIRFERMKAGELRRLLDGAAGAGGTEEHLSSSPRLVRSVLFGLLRQVDNRKGSDRKGIDRKGSDWKGIDRKGSDRKGSDWKESDRKESDRKESDRMPDEEGEGAEEVTSGDEVGVESSELESEERSFVIRGSLGAPRRVDKSPPPWTNDVIYSRRAVQLQTPHDVPPSESTPNTLAITHPAPLHPSSPTTAKRERRRQRQQRVAAATTLQKHFRGFRVRDRLSELDAAATRIQSRFRGHLVRNRMRRMDQAAVVIQKGFRRYLDHKTHDRLMAAVHKRHGRRRRDGGRRLRGGQDESRFRQPGVLRMPRSRAVLCFGGLESGGVDGERNSGSTIYSLDATTNQWSTIGHLPLGRAHAAACLSTDGHHLYISGGRDPTTSSRHPIPTANVWRLRVQDGSWHVSPSMRVARQRHGMAYLDGHLYVVSGSGVDGQPLNSLESYQPGGSEWTSKPPLALARCSAGVITHRGALWVCGGITYLDGGRVRKLTDRVEVYHPGPNTWVRSTSLPQARACFQAVSAGSLYVVGGLERDGEGRVHVTASVLVWRSRKMKWRHVMDMGTRRHDAGVIYLDPYLMVLGGAKFVSGPALASVECFDIREGEWVDVADSPLGLRGACCVALD